MRNVEKYSRVGQAKNNIMETCTFYPGYVKLQIYVQNM
jgi:hypothetical protein